LISACASDKRNWPEILGIARLLVYLRMFGAEL